MDEQLEAKFIECLDALAQGEPIERILTRYPQDAAQLRPLLNMAAGLPALRMEPSEAAKMQARQKFLAQADLLRRTPPRKTLGFLPRFATGFLAAALVAVVLSTSAVASAGSALPGDPLYGLKRTVEEVRLQSASSPTQRQVLEREFEQRRVEEAGELLDAGREGEVEFVGTIEVMQPNAWIISNLVVQVDANTRIQGTPQLNRLAEVRGVTGPKGLRATSISIEFSSEPVITPTPVMIAPTVIETPTPPGTPASTITVTPQITLNPPTVAPTATPTPRPTATAQPTATPQPVEVEFTGSVTAMNSGAWSIDGATILIDAGTEVRGAIQLGQRAKVRALRFADGRLVATRIELAEDGGDTSNNNENQAPNDNQNENDGNANDNGNANGNDDDGNNSGHGGNSNDDNSNNANGNQNED
jgi:hypothetical protein